MSISRTVMATAFALCTLAPTVATQSAADVGITFFQQGGVYCFRVAPEGTTLSDESTWTLMMLTGTMNKRNTCRIRSFEAGTSRVSSQNLKTVGLTVTEVWRRESVRDDFFARFASGITGNILRARVMTMTPPKLEAMRPEERANTYLKFADRGSRLDFEKVPDLTPEKFLAFQAYMPD